MREAGKRKWKLNFLTSGIRIKSKYGVSTLCGELRVQRVQNFYPPEHYSTDKNIKDNERTLVHIIVF